MVAGADTQAFSNHKKTHQKATHALGEHSHDHHHAHRHDHGHGHAHGHHHDHAHGHENHWMKALFGLLWGAGLLVFTLSGVALPFMAYAALTAATSLVTLYLGIGVYSAAWNALLAQRWNSNTLYSISTLTILAISILSIFIPGLPVMVEAAPLVLGFWHLGEGIEHTLLGEINKKLDVRDGMPLKVRMKAESTRDVLVTSLQRDDIIIVNSGDIIPVDGICQSEVFMDTASINGSPELKRFTRGKAIKSGMRVAPHSQALEMRVTESYKNSYLSLVAQNLKKADNQKAPMELFADKILHYFIPGLIGIALASGVIIGTFFTPALALECVVAVLVSACPCALSLITPMAVKIGIKKALEKGVYFKNGRALQASADIDSVVFDLNGTLTQGNVVVKSLSITDTRYLPYIALLEAQSSHPVAKVIQSYIEQKKGYVKKNMTITAVDKSHHSGVAAQINGELFIIGNGPMLKEYGITSIEAPYDNTQNGSIYIVCGKRVVGQIALEDPLREDAVATIKQLQGLGKTVHICTGADAVFAEHYAKTLGISPQHICANAVALLTKPGEVSKSDYVQKLQREGHKVAMVGDAANDVTAIAYSNIGIAIKSDIGAEVTQQRAGITLQQGLLYPIVTAFDVAKKTTQNITQNLFISLTYNTVITSVAAGLFVSLGFALNPALGVALMVLESTIVLANLYRLKHQNIQSLKTQPLSTGEVFESNDGSTKRLLTILDSAPNIRVVNQTQSNALVAATSLKRDGVYNKSKKKRPVVDEILPTVCGMG